MLNQEEANRAPCSPGAANQSVSFPPSFFLPWLTRASIMQIASADTLEGRKKEENGIGGESVQSHLQIGSIRGPPLVHSRNRLKKSQDTIIHFPHAVVGYTNLKRWVQLAWTACKAGHGCLIPADTFQDLFIEVEKVKRINFFFLQSSIHETDKWFENEFGRKPIRGEVPEESILVRRLSCKHRSPPPPYTPGKP